MTWYGFFQYWFLIALGASLYRNKMIWQESNRNYRMFLILACAPAGIVLNLLSACAFSLWHWVKGQKDILDGKEPSE